MRLFIAIDLPGEVKRSLGELQDPGLDLRWTSAETMHLTLRFVGEVEEPQKSRIARRLSEIDQPAFTLKIAGTGYFPRGKRPKVIWAGIGENKRLMQLQEKIEQACRAADLKPDLRDFHPHITLGRVAGVSGKEVRSFINRSKKLRIDGIPVRDFTLYESRLKPDGAVHTPLERYALDGSNLKSG